MSKLQIEVGADVSNAVNGFKKLEQQSDKTFSTIGNEVKAASSDVVAAAQRMARSADIAGGAVAKSKTNFTAWTRVIQDAPYGFNAISNNLEQLVPAAGAAGLAFSGIIAALSFAQLGLQNWIRGNHNSEQAVSEHVDAIKKAKQALDDYVASLDDISQVRVKGLQSAQDELVKLKTLYDATQNLNIPLSKRKKLVDELQEQYPKYFANLNDEIILTGGATKAYNDLRTAIISSARARAGQDALVDIQKQLLALEKQYAESTANVIKAQQKLATTSGKLFSTSNLGYGTSLNLTSTNKVVDAEKNLSAAKEKTAKIQKQINDLTERSKQLAGEINKVVQDNPNALLDPTGKSKKTSKKTAFLFDFLPFDPSGQLKPEQRSQLLDAIGKFQKEFGGLLKGVRELSLGTESQRIKSAIAFDLKLKAGKIEFDTKSFADGINKSLKPDELLPKSDLGEIDKSVVDKFTEGLKNEFDRVNGKDIFGNLDLTDSQTIDIFKTQAARLGAKLPQFFNAKDIFGNQRIVSLTDLFDTSKIPHDEAIKALQAAYKDITDKAIQESLAFSDTMQSITTKAFSSIGEAIGASLTGGGIGNVFQQFESFLGSSVESLGEKIIALNIAALALKKSLKLTFTNPAVGIAAGIGLVAIGAALKNLAGSGIKGFARGGWVGGTGNGDTVPAMLTPGEYVITKDKAPLFAALDKIMGKSLSMPKLFNQRLHFADGGYVPNISRNTDVSSPLKSIQQTLGGTAAQSINVTVNGKLQGNDIVFAVAKVVQSQQRNFGRGGF